MSLAAERLRAYFSYDVTPGTLTAAAALAATTSSSSGAKTTDQHRPCSPVGGGAAAEAAEALVIATPHWGVAVPPFPLLSLLAHTAATESTASPLTSLHSDECRSPFPVVTAAATTAAISKQRELMCETAAIIAASTDAPAPQLPSAGDQQPSRRSSVSSEASAVSPGGCPDVCRTATPPPPARVCGWRVQCIDDAAPAKSAQGARPPEWEGEADAATVSFACAAAELFCRIVHGDTAAVVAACRPAASATPSLTSSTSGDDDDDTDEAEAEETRLLYAAVREVLLALHARQRWVPAAAVACALALANRLTGAFPEWRCRRLPDPEDSVSAPRAADPQAALRTGGEIDDGSASANDSSASGTSGSDNDDDSDGEALFPSVAAEVRRRRAQPLFAARGSAPRLLASLVLLCCKLHADTAYQYGVIADVINRDVRPRLLAAPATAGRRGGAHRFPVLSGARLGAGECRIFSALGYDALVREGEYAKCLAALDATRAERLLDDCAFC